MKTVAPQILFETLCVNSRPQKLKNLQIVHEICAKQLELGCNDFSLATVGRLSEARGGISRRALYNSTSDAFKDLIRGWEAFASSKKQKAKQKAPEGSSDSSLLKHTSDPTLRTLFGYIVSERDRLRGEVKVLKANAKLVIDRRVLPGHINITQQGQVIQVINSAGLTDTEKQALAQAIAPEFMQQEKWAEGPHGEILNRHGHKLFDIGFTNAIRKLLAS